MIAKQIHAKLYAIAGEMTKKPNAGFSYAWFNLNAFMSDNKTECALAFENLEKSDIGQRLKFLDELLFALTIAGRVIWSDETATDHEKLQGLNWLNELTHRIWNIRLERNPADSNITERIREYFKEYGDRSELLKQQLTQTFLIAYSQSHIG